MAADLTVLLALARADQDRYARLATATSTAAGDLWARLAPIDDLALARWQRAIVPLVRSAQRAAAVQRMGYLTAYYRLAGEPAAQLDIDITGLLDGLRNGTPLTEVYARPVITVRKALSEGRSAAEALKIGGARTAMTAETDVMLAARQAEHATMQQLPRVVGYRRVPNGGACKLCLAAATQRYHVRDLRPCHANCHCGVVEIVGTQDPGHIIDHDAYQRLKADGAIDEATARKAAKVRYGGARTATERDLYVVHDHGELGPTLAEPGQHFTGPTAV